MAALRIGLATLLAVAATAPATAADVYLGVPAYVPVATAPANSSFPVCHDGRVLAKISGDFAWAHEVTWRTGLTMLGIDRIGEVPDGHYPANVFVRRYCRATAALANGDREPLYYRIEYPAGFAGTGWNVTFCLPGYDPWRVYGQNCSSIRP